MFDFPIRETIKRNLEINGRQYIIQFLEPSFYQILEFEKILKDTEKLNDWIIDFILGKLNLNKKELTAVQMNIDHLVRVFIPVYFQIPESKLKGGGNEQSLPSSYIITLSQAFHIDPLTMIKKYTRKQLNYLMEGYVFNQNRQVISQLKSYKKKTPEQNGIMNKCIAENMTLLSKTKYDSLDKEAMETELARLREIRRKRK